MLSEKQIKEAINDIENWNKELEASLKKGKYKKMSQSPYYFFRGTNHLFWKYFSTDKRLKTFSTQNSNVWIQGDLHAYNYGIYGNENADLIYGLNDFDESCIANYQFDLWRMACSIVLIARENKFEDIKVIHNILNSFSDNYIKAFKDYNEKGEIALQKVTKHNAFGKLDNVMQEVEEKDNREKMLKRWTKYDNGVIKFDLSYEKLSEINPEKRKAVEKDFISYVQRVKNNTIFDKDYFEILDIAHRVSSGTGSFGTPRYYILIKGNAKDEYGQVILDAKLQSKPSAYIFLDDNFKKQYNQYFDNEGIRHKQAYKALNYYIDKHLSWIKLPEGVFSVRERSPYKAYFPTELLNSEKRFSKLSKQWGNILACAHIKSFNKFDAKNVYKLIENDEIKFKKMIIDIAMEFADYNDTLYQQFIQLI